MSRVNGYACDGESCDKTTVTGAPETTPDGWITIYGHRSDQSRSSWNFCSWLCVRQAMAFQDVRGCPSFAVHDLPAVAGVRR